VDVEACCLGAIRPSNGVAGAAAPAADEHLSHVGVVTGCRRAVLFGMTSVSRYGGQIPVKDPGRKRRLFRKVRDLSPRRVVE